LFSGEEAGEPQDPSAGPSVNASRYVPVAEFRKVVAELAALKATASETEVTRTVDDAIKAGKLAPAMRETGLVLCRTSKAAFNAYVESMAPMFNGMRRSIVPDGPPFDMASASSPETASVFKALGHSVEDVNKYGKKVKA
jgi:phage I-like protein